VEDLTNAMNLIVSLQGKSYVWKKDQAQGDDSEVYDGKRVIGFIAQEVQKVVPEVSCYWSHFCVV
jgi:hypothetical protein